MALKEPETILVTPCLPIRWWSKETVAVVTGANKGIGFALVKRLAKLGLTVVLTARDNGRGLNAVELLKNEGLHVYFFPLDVSEPASIKIFASWFQEKFGMLDILKLNTQKWYRTDTNEGRGGIALFIYMGPNPHVNNAGVSFNDIGENSVEHAEIVIKTNFYGSKWLTEALLPMFRRSDSAGRILNISSRLGLLNKLKNPKLREMLLDEEKLSENQIDGMVKLFIENVKSGTWKSHGWPEIWTDYAVSKLALNAHSKILAMRFLGLGLCVNCFCPGFTQTSMTGGKGKHTSETAAEVAACLVLLPPEKLLTGKFYVASSTGVYSKL